jgi:hypothetical protein
MAISLASNALSHYRLSTYKTITIILVLFFIYDVFMVFVTPTFTNGTSIMEAVAFGGKEAADSIRAQVSHKNLLKLVISFMFNDLLFHSNQIKDWSNIQFSHKKDTSNKVN